MRLSNARGGVPRSAASSGGGDGGAVPDAVRLGFHDLQRRLRLRQPRQERVQRAVEVVQRVHRRLQRLATVYDAETDASS